MPLVQLADALLTDLAPRNPHERVRRAVAVARATTGEEGRALLRERRTALADRLLPLVRQRWGDAEAARLLTACSGPVVAEALPGLGYAVPSWSSLTMRYPEPVIAYAQTEVAALDTEARVGWWGRSGPIQRALALHQPAALLDLCERFLIGAVPWTVWLSLHRLLAVDPARVARLLLAEPTRPGKLAAQRLSRSVRDRLATLPDADLGGLPPSRREAVFDAAYAGRELAAQVLPDEILTVLPHERRHAEARRMLALPVVATETATRLRTTAFLPYPEAVAVLDKASRSAEAEERAYAYELLVRCAARTGDPTAVAELLAGLKRIRNEQDPVRSRLLSALAEVRPDLFGVATIGALDGLVRDALDARDCSGQTHNAVMRLVFRVLWHSAAAAHTQPLMLWALETVERIRGWQRPFMMTDLSRTLRRGQEHAVFGHMRQWLTDALRRNDAWPVLSLAQSLHKRAWDMPALQELIGQATRLKSDSAVSSAVSLWLVPPRGRAAKVDILAARDESLLTLGAVLSVAVRQRTGLIDEYVLGGRPLRGRFGTRKAVWVPAVDPPALALWTPEQVERYAAVVRRAIEDRGLDRWRRAALVR